MFWHTPLKETFISDQNPKNERSSVNLTPSKFISVLATRPLNQTLVSKALDCATLTETAAPCTGRFADAADAPVVDEEEAGDLMEDGRGDMDIPESELG